MRTFKRVVKETIKIHTLFDLLDIADKENETHIPNFQLKVKTPYGYNNINALFRTEKQMSVTCYFGNNKTLKCSMNHRLKVSNDEEGWKKVKDITSDDIIETETGITYLKSLEPIKEEILYDIEVDKVNCYYSNKILSHNSWILVNMGYGALLQGKKVVHYTLELNENYVGLRYDARYTGIPFQDLKYNVDQVKSELDKWKDKSHLIVKDYPTKSAGVETIRSHVNNMIMLDNRPDMIILDYADLLKGNQQLKKVERIEEIYELLRGLAGEFQIPIITCSQANRSGEDSDILIGTSISDAYAKLMISDIVISVSRKAEDKVNGTGRFHFIKNRFGPDGITLPSKINMAIGKIDIFQGDSEDGQAVKKTMGENGERQLLAQKFKDLSVSY